MTAPVLLRGRCLDESGERDCIIQFDGLDKIAVTVADGPIPAIGSRMVCSSPQLGLLTFNVAAIVERGIQLDLLANNDRRRRLAARLEWLSVTATMGERRVAARVVPKIRDVSVEWAGTRASGRIRDLSASGAAIDLPEQPPVGASITVGARRAVVARHTEDGIAVRFVLPLHPADVHEDAML